MVRCNHENITSHVRLLYNYQVETNCSLIGLLEKPQTEELSFGDVKGAIIITCGLPEYSKGGSFSSAFKPHVEMGVNG